MGARKIGKSVVENGKDAIAIKSAAKLILFA
jgi:hypothetical protein